MQEEKEELKDNTGKQEGQIAINSNQSSCIEGSLWTSKHEPRGA